ASRSRGRSSAGQSFIEAITISAAFSPCDDGAPRRETPGRANKAGLPSRFTVTFRSARAGPLPVGSLTGKHVILGVTGGIAAYKSPDIVRRLRDEGAEVRVVMTAS